MKIFIMRHGEAGYSATSDADRELTERGGSQSIAVARAVISQGYSEFDYVLVSPYIRAQQTWDAISHDLSARETETYDEITPYGQSDDAYHYISALASAKQLDSVFIVSHLPLVGYLTAEFVKDMTPPMFPTSGLVCLEYDPETQKGEFLWHVHP
ncbi:phosphohistidine phosphatase SixA [Vibrio sp. JC009]|uniref:phosphohistidine phosphatase SixA n=1 Tax=Vibrio sp. JC009 TaxID=2912314 RepID=UPI0023B0049B|nr:phosphohistidine phosphatase SixA [Vibrio sp. JC009]WED20979.1 phosphohistidine phosphatase SixA [Vibrio sp. JC009]